MRMLLFFSLLGCGLIGALALSLHMWSAVALAVLLLAYGTRLWCELPPPPVAPHDERIDR